MHAKDERGWTHPQPFAIFQNGIRDTSHPISARPGTTHGPILGCFFWFFFLRNLSTASEWEKEKKKVPSRYHASPTATDTVLRLDYLSSALLKRFGSGPRGGGPVTYTRSLLRVIQSDFRFQVVVQRECPVSAHGILMWPSCLVGVHDASLFASRHEVVVRQDGALSPFCFVLCGNFHWLFLSLSLSLGLWCDCYVSKRRAFGGWCGDARLVSLNMARVVGFAWLCFALLKLPERACRPCLLTRRQQDSEQCQWLSVLRWVEG